MQLNIEQLEQNNKSVQVSHGQHITDSHPVRHDLMGVLAAAQRSRRLQQMVKQIRQKRQQAGKDGVKKLKKKLPYVIVPGLLDGDGVTEGNLVGITPVLPIDIDHLSPDDASQCRDKLTETLGKHAYYFGISPSGCGVRGFISIENTDRWMDHWRALYHRLQELGYEQDLKTKNPVQKYYLTYDPDAFFGDPEQIEPFVEKVEEKKKKKKADEGTDGEASSGKNSKKRKAESEQKGSSRGSEAGRLERYVGMIGEKGVDLTADRDNWIRIAFALVDGCGTDTEKARELFHRVSRFYPDYTEEETDEIFDDVAERYDTGEDKTRVGTFYKICHDAGIQPDPPKASKKKEQKKNDKKNKIRAAQDFIVENYELHWNRMLKRLEVRDAKSGELRPITDRDQSTIALTVQRDVANINKDQIRTILNSDLIPEYHPVTDYFNKLPAYDAGKEPDHIQQLADTITTVRLDQGEVSTDGSSDHEWWSRCLRKWLVGMLAGWFEEDRVNHQILVLGGEQGIGKSTWMERLLPRALADYTYVGPIEAGAKDSLIHISENLLIILDELSSLDRGTVKDMKALITQSVIKFRKPYGEHPESRTRYASFAGTTNDEEFLRDPTGSRRWLIFWADKIDKDHEVPIDRVIAQAKHLYDSGFQYWFDQEENKEIEKRNEEHRVTSMEEEVLLKYFEPRSKENADVFLNATEILEELQAAAEKIHFDKGAKVKMGGILSRNGFQRFKRMNFYRYAIGINDYAKDTLYKLRELPGGGFFHEPGPSECGERTKGKAWQDPWSSKNGNNRQNPELGLDPMWWGGDSDSDPSGSSNEKRTGAKRPVVNGKNVHGWEETVDDTPQEEKFADLEKGGSDLDTDADQSQKGDDEDSSGKKDRNGQDQNGENDEE